ncbi:ATP/GTP-binding protein [Streptomyces sp. S07_1.15]|uniref:ATP/GTP-binding protein n=1 Tax=Streptomyces sp. S07_1.15 TaxID=2873925 RepID=UPI001D151D64|nr:ATP/GTP-binding protein [Streptomyces sp. S07_1.15]MCC3655856.1 ATP/GTP-binding protein [Streptomyces sp. S07_1.15]
MGTRTVTALTADRPAAGSLPFDAFLALLSALGWLAGHVTVVALAGLVVCVAGAVVQRQLADRASAQRMAVELVPSRHFDPGSEEILRYGVQLARAAGAGPWWVPRPAKSVRIRLGADGLRPLTFQVEGPASAAKLLQTTPYAKAVRCERPRPRRKKPPKHVVRAEFTVRGRASAFLREVPLEPDPLQPLVDAVADLNADLGDTAEVCIDVQRAPRWRLRARRWQVVEEARHNERRAARQAARWVRQDSLDVEDSFTYQLTQALSPGRSRGGGRLMFPPAPRRIEREKVLGKLTDEAHLLRVQLLVRCTSDIEGRAQSRLRQVEASLDVFNGPARLVMKGWRVGPWRLGADRWPWRQGFDHRWRTGQIHAPRTNWVRVEELAGLLKPPTVHCHLPVLASAVPSFAPGHRNLVLQGWHRSADRAPRLVATYEHETLFETAVGKSGWGKTERALCQAVGLAHAGRGLLFVDPHGDSWQRAEPFLAHDAIRERVVRIDLAAGGRAARLASWNLLGVDRGQRPHEVVPAVVDGFASVLGWTDVTAPRAITIFTKAVQALTTLNAAACAEGTPQMQATIFQVRALLSDEAFRALALDKLERLDPEQVSWWRSTFSALPPDALPVVLNPLDRLAAQPVSRAFLGSPVGSYDLRSAMDEEKVVWICPAGSGPTDRLLVALLIRDLLRAGLSRREVPAQDRTPFRAYLDELITLDGAASASIAEMLEQLRKFNIRLHGMTQLLQRLSDPVRASLLQNSSTLTVTAGAIAAIRQITAEWGDHVDPGLVTELDRFRHYATLTVKGSRVGPLQLRGPALEDLASVGLRPQPARVEALRQTADDNAGARPLADLAEAARRHTAHVQQYLAGPGPSSGGRRTERVHR